MTPRELMHTLVDHEDVLVDAIALSLRSMKFGRGESAFFESKEEIIAVVRFLFDHSEDWGRDAYKSIKQITDGWKENKEINQSNLKELRSFIFAEIRTLLDLLANIDKAKETLEFWDEWEGE